MKRGAVKYGEGWFFKGDGMGIGGDFLRGGQGDGIGGGREMAWVEGGGFGVVVGGEKRGGGEGEGV